jgi:two-component system, chemotaxis family, protein-glutamate methylesterase/glutaminase
MGEKKKDRDIRVSVIESDILMRQILSSMLRKEEGIRLTGSTAFSTIESHLEAIASQKPDVVMIGIDRPESETNQLLEKLRETYPEIYAVVMTPLSSEGAGIALEALKKGAIDYITKPDRRSGLILASRHFHKRVLPLIKAVPRLNRHRTAEPETDKSDRTVTESLKKGVGRTRVTPGNTELIVIGSCLGGITSLYKVVAALPESLPVPVVIIQHMPKIYTSELAADLDKVTMLHVREAQDNSVLIPGQVYVAPGGYHSVIKGNGSRKYITLHRGPREHKCRPSIDVLLRSAVQNYGSRILGVFLSGGGSDGIQGASFVLDRGGRILVENQDSSLLWDMPRKVQMLSSEIRAYPAARLGAEIIRMLKTELQPKSIRTIREDSPAADWLAGTVEN